MGFIWPQIHDSCAEHLAETLFVVGLKHAVRVAIQRQQIGDGGHQAGLVMMAAGGRSGNLVIGTDPCSCASDIANITSDLSHVSSKCRSAAKCCHRRWLKKRERLSAKQNGPAAFATGPFAKKRSIYKKTERSWVASLALAHRNDGQDGFDAGDCCNNLFVGFLVGAIANRQKPIAFWAIAVASAKAPHVSVGVRPDSGRIALQAFW